MAAPRGADRASCAVRCPNTSVRHSSAHDLWKRVPVGAGAVGRTRRLAPSARRRRVWRSVLAQSRNSLWHAVAGRQNQTFRMKMKIANPH
eukprot:9272354-Alexandrium_andersonii.AAC.1